MAEYFHGVINLIRRNSTAMMTVRSIQLQSDQNPLRAHTVYWTLPDKYLNGYTAQVKNGRGLREAHGTTADVEFAGLPLDTAAPNI